MAIGLKIRDVRRFGRKLEKGVRTVGRGIARGADVFGAIATPIATAIGGPAAGIAVSKGVEGVKKLAQKAEQLTSKGVSKGIGLYKRGEDIVYGTKDVARGIGQAFKDPTKGNIMIGDAIARIENKKPSIQAE